jgi:hypothetical protein
VPIKLRGIISFMYRIMPKIEKYIKAGNGILDLQRILAINNIQL